MVNRVIIMGHLGRDPEVRRLDNGASVASFSVATNENYKDRNGEWHESTEWHNVVAWRYLAEKAEKSLHKGSLVYIEGKLTHRSYQDKENNTRYITEVVASTLRHISPNREEGGEDNKDRSYPRNDDSQGETAKKVEPSYSGNDVPSSHAEEGDDDLPF